MPDPQCIKTYYQTTMMPKVPQSMGFYYGQTPKELHCARTALKAPHMNHRDEQHHANQGSKLYIAHACWKPVRHRDGNAALDTCPL